jgi:GDP-D-mannose dehydratase
MTIRRYCRICESNKLDVVISLGQQKITSIFPLFGEHTKIPTSPVNLCICSECGLIQLQETFNADSMYKNGNYGYNSGISNTMRQHLKQYNNEICGKVSLNKEDTVLDIGSNDATFLKYYNNDINKIGVDPTGEQFKDQYSNIDLLSDYFTKENFINTFGDIKCKIITSICCFYDLPNPVKFAKDIYNILDDEGIWSCEQSYLLTMLKTNSLDTICHEHLEYYALTQVKDIADRANLKIIDIKFNSSNGGSFRVYFAKISSKTHIECKELIQKILNEEEEYDIKNPNTYKEFVNRCDVELKKLTDFIDLINLNNKTIQIYGASTKGNCILQYCNIGPKQIKYAVERNPKKVGLCTNTGIEIIIEEDMRKNPPDYLMVLPWHFKKEIIEREKDYLDNGGQLIFYFPTFEIISNKPKTLVTGCDGFIASYIKQNFQDHNLYGITRTKNNIEKNIVKCFFNMNDYNKLENIIRMINPENIIHLASISSSIEAFEHPFETLQNNGMLTAKLCDIIYRNNKKIRLFNASSSEIYKGHLDYYLKDDIEDSINNTFHNHPYSIAKIMGQNMVQFYRNNYDLHLSNGIIFTTQSERKSDKFLLNKISTYIKNWKKDTSIEPLVVGDLNSYRNIIHPKDVVSAIRCILDYNKGDDYSICSYNSYSIFSLVEKLFNKADIKIIRGVETNTYYDKNTNKPIMIIKTDSNTGLDTTEINIKGYPSKLRNIEWKIKYSIDDILDEL